MAIEIVDLPIEKCDFPLFFVGLPEVSCAFHRFPWPRLHLCAAAAAGILPCAGRRAQGELQWDIRRGDMPNQLYYLDIYIYKQYIYILL